MNSGCEHQQLSEGPQMFIHTIIHMQRQSYPQAVCGYNRSMKFFWWDGLRYTDWQ